MKSNRKSSILDFLVSHAITWETGRASRWYDQEYYLHTDVETDSEKHYGSQIGCKRCRRLREAGLRGIEVQSGPSALTIVGLIVTIVMAIAVAAILAK